MPPKSKPVKIGYINVGEFWHAAICEGCGKRRSTLTLNVLAGDSGFRGCEICAYCLRKLASDLDEFERDHINAANAEDADRARMYREDAD